MRVLEIDRRAQGTPEAFTEPPAGARAALPRLDKAMQNLDQLRQKQTAYLFEAQRLRDGLHAAREHDRAEAAEAAAAGQPCPPSTVEAAEAEAAKQSRLAVALVDKINAAQNDVTQLIIRERDTFARDLEQRIAQHAAEYEAAISRLEQARDRLADNVIVSAWITHHPADAPLPQVMQIDQPEVLKDQPKRLWSAVRDDLRRDAATLPHLGPLNISGKAIDRHRGFVAQEGGRTRWFKGGTPGYWDAQDRIARINASIKPTDAA